MPRDHLSGHLEIVLQPQADASHCYKVLQRWTIVSASLLLWDGAQPALPGLLSHLGMCLGTGLFLSEVMEIVIQKFSTQNHFLPVLHRENISGWAKSEIGCREEFIQLCMML